MKQLSLLVQIFDYEPSFSLLSFDKSDISKKIKEEDDLSITFEVFEFEVEDDFDITGEYHFLLIDTNKTGSFNSCMMKPLFSDYIVATTKIISELHKTDFHYYTDAVEFHNENEEDVDTMLCFIHS